MRKAIYDVAKFRRVFRAAALIVLMTVCGGIFGQTVSISPTTGNVISNSSYNGESHLNGFGGAWVHNQLPMTLISSDKETLTESGLMSEHANNITAEGQYLIFASGEASTTINHMSLSLPRGYRFTSYKMVLEYDTSSKTASVFKEMDSTFTAAYETATVAKDAKGVTMQRTSLNSTDMGNILYFRQDHKAGMARVKVVSFVITFECTDKFGLVLRPDETQFTSPVCCISLPFQTQRVDLGEIKKETDNGYTSYKYNYKNVKDLQADFLFYDTKGIVGGKAVPGTAGDQCITAVRNVGDRTFMALKNNTYWLESPTEALAQDGKTTVPVGYRIVGARVVYSNSINPDFKKGDNILISDGKGNYMNHNLKFTATKVVWKYGTDGKVSTTAGSTTYYLRHSSQGFIRPTVSLDVTTSVRSASPYNTDGLNLFYGSGNDTYVISYNADGNAVYNNAQQYALVQNADYQGSGSSFTVRLYDKTGENVEHEAMVSNDNPSGDLVLEKINNDAVKMQIEGLEDGQRAYVCLEVQLEALNPYIDKMDISCTQPSGEKKLKNQYLADDFTIGTGGKVDFSVPTNFGTTGLRFAFEGLHSKTADETYTGIGTPGEYSRYHFVKSPYYNLIGENLQQHRQEAADYDYTAKLSVDVAGDKAFYCNNSDKFKAGTSGSETFMYEEYRYSNDEYDRQGGKWDYMLANNGDDYETRYLVVCDETRYNIAPTTTPRHAYYAYYSTDLKLTTVDYEPVITYTKVYNDGVQPTGYDSNYYVGATVTLKDTGGKPVTSGSGYVYAKQIIDRINADIADGAENAPVDTKHILYFDASGINSLLFSSTDASWGKLEDLKAELGDNALMYLPQGVTYGISNVATRSMYGDDFVASNDVVLTDQKPFFAPYDICMNAANEVVYSRMMTQDNNTKRWVSLVLPFTVAVDTETGKYEQSADNSEFTFYTMNESNAFSNEQSVDGYKYDIDAHFSPYTGVPVTEPNKPYLVGIDRMETAEAGSKLLFTVRQKGATIVKTPATLSDQRIDGGTSSGVLKGTSYSLHNYGTYSGSQIPKEEGVLYFNKDKFISSLILSDRYTMVYVLPFRGYYMAEGNASNVRYMYITTEPNGETSFADALQKENMPDGILFSSCHGQLTLSATRDLRAAIRSLAGVTVQNVSLREGETVSLSLPSGIYVVNGCKVVVK